jgi:hypothetical protein
VIATEVSAQNNRPYCHMVYDAIAAIHLHDNENSSFRVRLGRSLGSPSHRRT